MNEELGRHRGREGKVQCRICETECGSVVQEPPLQALYNETKHAKMQETEVILYYQSVSQCEYTMAPPFVESEWSHSMQLCYDNMLSNNNTLPHYSVFSPLYSPSPSPGDMKGRKV